MKNKIIFYLASIIACLSFLDRQANAADSHTLESVMAGVGSIKFDGILQAWAVNDTSAPNDAKFNFRLRRAEIKFRGTIVENARWFLMIDPAKNLSTGAVSNSNDNKILQDLGIAYDLTPKLEFLIGQFKILTTAESLDSSAELYFPERTFIARAYGDRREPGASLTYKESNWKLAAMISDGQRTNVSDTTNSKDIHVRADVTPITDLNVGAFTTAGDFNYGTKARWGVNARYKIDNLLLRVEGVTASDLGVKTKGIEEDVIYSINDHWQPVARFEIYDGGVLISHATSFGVNYYISKHNAKIQGIYELMDNMSGNNGVGAEGTYVPASNHLHSEFVLAFQAAW